MTIVTVPCPVLLQDGTPCEADVQVEVHYDAGQRQTHWEPGIPSGYYAGALTPCPDHPRLTRDEETALEQHAVAWWRDQ